MNSSFSDIAYFEKLFKSYFEPLVNFVNSRIQNYEDSEEIVQEMFAKLWANKNTLVINTSTKSYLYQATKNTMIDFIRKSKIKTVDIEGLQPIAEDAPAELDLYLFRSELEDALTQLKEKNRLIFRLNKFEGLTYKEIADHLNMSERGIEDNIARAMKVLRNTLKKNIYFNTDKNVVYD